MFGVIPAHQHFKPGAAEIYGARALGSVVAALGIASLLLLAAMPELLGSGGLGAVLIGVPLAVAGLVGLLIGYAALSTRLEITPDGLAVEAPSWRAVPIPPVQQLQVGWHEVRAIRHRTELYRFGPLPARLPLEVFAIETARGRIVLGGYYLWELEPVLIEIAHRADRPWREDGTVEASLLHTLRSGPPAWGSLETPPTTVDRIRRVARFARRP
ncbi:MAG: hypothetical protein ACREH3_02250 [Geminicoccales bacterium]